MRKISHSQDILFKDQDIVVSLKPSGIATYPDWTDRLRKRLQRSLFPVHRIDQATSGLLLFATNSDIASRLIKAFEQKKIQKIYTAVVDGSIKSQRINLPLVHPKTKQRQSASTKVDLIESFEWSGATYSIVSLTPLTGRFHQLRRHLKMVGNRIVGDTPDAKKDLYLTASTLTFQHPRTKKRAFFEINPEQEFRKLNGILSHFFKCSRT